MTTHQHAPSPSRPARAPRPAHPHLSQHRQAANRRRAGWPRYPSSARGGPSGQAGLRSSCVLPVQRVSPASCARRPRSRPPIARKPLLSHGATWAGYARWNAGNAGDEADLTDLELASGDWEAEDRRRRTLRSLLLRGYECRSCQPDVGTDLLQSWTLCGGFRALPSCS